VGRQQPQRSAEATLAQTARTSVRARFAALASPAAPACSSAPTSAPGSSSPPALVALRDRLRAEPPAASVMSAAGPHARLSSQVPPASIARPRTSVASGSSAGPAVNSEGGRLATRCADACAGPGRGHAPAAGRTPRVKRASCHVTGRPLAPPPDGVAPDLESTSKCSTGRCQAGNQEAGRPEAEPGARPGRSCGPRYRGRARLQPPRAGTARCA